MKILFLTRRFYPDVGGVEKHIYKISERLIAKGHQVVVVSEKALRTTQAGNLNYHSGLSSDSEAIISKRPVKSIRFDTFDSKKIGSISLKTEKNEKTKKFKIWSQLWDIKGLIQEADVVHCHDVFYWYLPFRFIFPFKKVFTTFHGYETYPLPKKNIILHKLWEKLSNGNIVVGKFIQKWYGTHPDYIIYGASDSIVLKKAEKPLKNSAYFVGRLDEQTNILDYVNATEIIKNKSKDFKLIIAGDGKYKGLAKRQGKILGFINNPEKYFGKYRYAFISRYLAMIEAMLAKKLIFAIYDNPIKGDYLKLSPFAKLSVVVSSPEELAEKVLYFMKNPKKEKEIVEKAYAWAKDQTWEKVVNTYLKLWQKG